MKRSEAFLKSIGPRELTREEREELRLLRIEEGDKSARALKLSDRIAGEDQGGGEESGAVKSKFLK